MPEKEFYDGGVFAEHLPKGRKGGQIQAGPLGLTFDEDGVRESMPYSGLEMKMGGAANRHVYFTHASRPGVTLYTTDRSILKSHYFRDVRETKQAASQVRSSGKARIARLWVTLAALCVVFVIAVIGLWLAKGVLVAAVASQVPAEWEKQLGDAGFEELSDQYTELTDPQILAAINQIAQPVFDAVPEKEAKRYDFQLHVFATDDVNAFALPGGRMVLFTGLIEAAESPEEIAGVIGHEIAHVTKQHGVRAIIDSTGTFILLAAVVGDLGGMSGIILGSSHMLLTQKYSRDHEREADRVGFEYVSAAEINPRGLVSFFETMYELEQEMMRDVPVALRDAFGYVSTHPATEERIEAMEKMLEKAEKPVGGYRDFELDFSRLKERIRLYRKANPVEG